MTDADAERATAGWQRWALIGLVALAIAGLAFAIGRFSTFGSAGPSATPTNNSADAGFARDMQVHHTQAIEMAMEIYRKTDDPDILSLSYDIATTQAGQRGEMYDWLVKWGLPQLSNSPMAWMTQGESAHEHGEASDAPMTDEEMREAMGMASPAELVALQQATGLEADCLFLELMIRHHAGAIPMADALVDLGTDQRAIAVAATMSETQSFEIDAMESIQARLGCSG
ncbi:DUF305 domain-containing protein [Microbacterium lacus]|uniref:DUF305 domain-containing protein n=1 Tax=Microbacterium lacus TaxID=415217 RepID=UPI00385078FA